MKLAVSLLNYRPGNVGGIETYIQKLVETLAAHTHHDVHFITGPDVADRLPANASRQLIPLSATQLIGWRCVEAFTPVKARRMARRIDAAGYDAILFPQQSVFPIGIKTPAVLTVVDVQHLHHPEHYALFDTCFRRTIYPASLDRSRRIIAISHATQTDLVELCGVDAATIDVVHLGFDAIPAAPAATSRLVDAPYLYYPAATFPHKGHADLLRGFARLKATRGSDLKLILSGMQTSLWKSLQKQIVALGLQAEVHHLGFVPREAVVALYQHAEAICFPTQFEGFGMPVLEAVRYSKPIFCSDLSIFDELGVPPENRIDFTDENALVGIIDHLTPTTLLRTPITWAQCAEKTLQVMAKAVECEGND